MARAMSLRKASREKGVGRETLGEAFARFERGLPDGLPGRRIGPRRVLVLDMDVDNWIRGAVVRPSAHAEDVVSARLEREAAQGGAP